MDYHLPGDLVESFFSLFYPELCCACGRNLKRGETVVCSRCRLSLPRTDHFNKPGNSVERLFYGQSKVRAAAAYLSFSKGGHVQRLAHLLKYGGRQDVGQFIGKMIGERLNQHERFQGIELIVPVPLHEKRLRRRGYNQAACIAEGISHASGIPFLPDALIRLRSSDTQTDKSRFERSENVFELFRATDPQQLDHRHLLLVDDVVTTGATLIACSEAIQRSVSATVSIVAMAGTCY